MKETLRRLAPDMFDLGQQVQIACNHAKGGGIGKADFLRGVGPFIRPRG